jgi:hypothetical protein
MDYRIDRDKREVTADLAGLVTSRSVFLGAEGGVARLVADAIAAEAKYVKPWVCSCSIGLNPSARRSHPAGRFASSAMTSFIVR